MEGSVETNTANALAYVHFYHLKALYGTAAKAVEAFALDLLWGGSLVI